ncbi:MAG: CPBP family intramembrane glutamic endopeptidase [Lachnospiraceae bacterium]
MNKIKEQGMIKEFMLWTFGIAWGSEILLILGKHFSIFSGIADTIITYLVIGFGAGAAPAYACYIVFKKCGKIKGFRNFMGIVFRAESIKKTMILSLIFAFSQLLFCLVCEEYRGGAWYLFIVYLPLMVFGGGLEEIGWRGLLQPCLEKKFSFTAAALIEGLIWAVWHLPLWFVSGTSQSSYNFISFASYCLALGFMLAAFYQLTKCIFAGVLLHAWGNVTFGGTFTLYNLENLQSVETTIFYIVEIILAIIVIRLICPPPAVITGA